MTQDKLSSSIESTPEKIREALKQSDASIERYLQLNKMASIGGAVHGIAHTFNNILGGILGYSQLLGEELKDNPEASRHARVIEKAAKRASRLVYQLQILANKKTFTLKKVDSLKIVTEVTEIIESSLNKSIILKKNFHSSKIYLIADDVAISHALLNVCINAKQAMPDGGELMLETQNVTRELPVPQGKNTLQNAFEISVKDTGCGISPEQLPFVFEPFFSTRDVQTGAGMGLTVAKDIVARHGGIIHLDSKEGVGTTVTITLPLDSTHTDVLHNIEKRSPVTFNGKCILVVDDEQDLQMLAKRILEHKGGTVLLAGSGAQAIELIREKSCDLDLVILDMILPEGDGKSVYKVIKAVDKNLPVILTSGYNNKFNYDEIIRGANDIFIQKPWDVEFLLDAAQKLLKNA